MAYTQDFVFSKWVEFQGLPLSCPCGSFGCFSRLKNVSRGVFYYISCVKVIYIWCPTRTSHCVKSVQIQRFFWSVFSYIRTEYGSLRSKSPYSVQIQKNTDQKKLRIWTLLTQWVRAKSIANFKVRTF